MAPKLQRAPARACVCVCVRARARACVGALARKLQGLHVACHSTGTQIARLAIRVPFDWHATCKPCTRRANRLARGLQTLHAACQTFGTQIANLHVDCQTIGTWIANPASGVPFDWQADCRVCKRRASRGGGGRGGAGGMAAKSARKCPKFGRRAAGGGRQGFCLPPALPRALKARFGVSSPSTPSGGRAGRRGRRGADIDRGRGSGSGSGSGTGTGRGRGLLRM